MSQEEDAERFFADLAGRARQTLEQPKGAAAVRTALQAQIETIRDAERAAVEDLSAEERARMDAIKRRLLAEGVFSGPSRDPAASPHAPGVQRALEWLRSALGGSGWPRWVTVAASLLIVCGVILQLALPPSTPPDVERGAVEPIVWAADAAAAAQRLAAALHRAGAEALVVRIDQTEWVVRIDNSDTGNRAAVLEALAGAGIDVDGDPPDRVIVRERR